MSSRAGKMEKEMLVKQVKQAQQEVKDVDIRIDIDLSKGDNILSKSAYVKITGVPKDLPPEMEGTIIQHAQHMFAEVLNEGPVFINLKTIDTVKVIKVTKIN